MKKRTIAFLGLAAVAGLSLTSCGEKPVANENPLGRLDIHVNYTGKQGISLVSGTFNNTVEGVNYVQGDLLPTWEAFADLIGADIKDAAGYSTTTDDDTYNLVKNAGYKNDNDEAQQIDLFYNTTKNINAMGKADEAVNLLNYIDEMPNFKAWLEANPTMMNTIMEGSAIYYTPYFDGYQDIERMFVMDTELAETVLDSTTGFDTETTNGGASASKNVVQKGVYQPYVNPDYNYAEAQTVQILDGSTVKNITIAKTTNIIKQQNDLLADGCTGQQLAEQLQEYLKTAFAAPLADGTYKNLSEIYISEKAAYNADELIALMRVVKANPKLISGSKDVEVEIIVPRGGANNRVDNIADFMQLWGVQGMTSKKEMLYFNSQGQLNDASLTSQTYEALENLSAMYDEGLIIGDFFMSDSKLDGTYYLNKYFGKTKNEGGYAFMLYDYAASTGATNSIVDGIGTKPESVIEGYSARTGVRPVLPPLSYWATGSEFNPLTQELRDFTGKSLIRYYEENRSLKSNAWCIPTTSDNIPAALAMMDALFTDEGTFIQDFGPNNGKYWTLGEIGGQKNVPVMTTEIKTLIGTTSIDFWTFMRQYVGSTHGVGHVRTTAIQIQSCNAYAQVGLANVEAAIAAGVVNFNLVDKDKTVNASGYTWDTTVPTAGYPGITTDNSIKYDAITSFWKSDKCATTAKGWVQIVVNPTGTFTKDSTAALGVTSNSTNYSYKDVFDQWQEKIDIYLYAYANKLNAVPSYAQK